MKKNRTWKYWTRKNADEGSITAKNGNPPSHPSIKLNWAKSPQDVFFNWSLRQLAVEIRIQKKYQKIVFLALKFFTILLQRAQWSNDLSRFLSSQENAYLKIIRPSQPIEKQTESELVAGRKQAWKKNAGPTINMQYK